MGREDASDTNENYLRRCGIHLNLVTIILASSLSSANERWKYRGYLAAFADKGTVSVGVSSSHWEEGPMKGPPFT